MTEPKQPDNKRRRVNFSKEKIEIRDTHEKVRTAKKRTEQSARWLERQLNDPYVKRARAEAVSYTHLDVYKRQVLVQLAMAAGAVL